ncbi:MAG: histidinol-phosphate transaminase [Verrucomicrobiota bacterium]
MTYQDLVKPAVLAQPTYVPGRPIQDVARQFGLDPETVFKLASNENPLGPSPKAVEAAIEAMKLAHLYPDGGAVLLREKLAEVHELSPEQFIVGTGSNEVMMLLTQAFAGPGDEVIYGQYAFLAYKLATMLYEATPVELPMPDLSHNLAAMADAVTEKTRIIFLPSPNNPTGTANNADEILAFARDLPEHVIFCFDEAYVHYLDNPPDLRPLIAEGRKVFCMRTFSKIYGLASFRIGYGYGSEEVVALLNQIRQPFNCNGIAQAAALAALDDHDFVARSKAVNRAGLGQLREGFARLGLKSPPSTANFVLLEVEKSQEIFDLLQRRGIIVRPLHGYGLSDYLRITVGTEADNTRLLNTLEAMLAGPEAAMLKGELVQG